MAKTFIEMTNTVSRRMFHCEKKEDGKDQPREIDTLIQAIIDSGISAAIPRTLYLLMDKDPKEEVKLVVGPFTYGISMRKSGDSYSFNPTFELTNEKKTLNELAQFEESLEDNIEMLEKIAETITDSTFLDTVIHCCKLDVYDTTKSEWVEKVADADKGASLDAATAGAMVAIHVATILHILANMKDAEKRVSYEVNGEGTYTIERVKDKWTIGFVAGKEFKQAIKNDRLVDSLE